MKTTYQCELCGEVSRNKQALGAHYRYKHPTRVSKRRKYKKKEKAMWKKFRERSPMTQSTMENIKTEETKPAPSVSKSHLRFCPHCGADILKYLAASDL